MGRRSKLKKPKTPGHNALDEIPRHLRPVGELEDQLAKQIIEQRGEEHVSKQAELGYQGKVEVPSVDLHNVIAQMKSERERSKVESGIQTFEDVTRYGLFLKAAHAKLGDEIPRARHRLGLAKALCDRQFRTQSELSRRRSDLAKADRHMGWLIEAGTLLNKNMEELKRDPMYLLGMAELRARDIVQPHWESTQAFKPAPDAEDDLGHEDENLSFEELLAQEKARKAGSGKPSTADGANAATRGEPRGVKPLEDVPEDISFEELLAMEKRKT